jgi:hypothetical protein
MVRIGLVCLFAALAASPVGAQLAYRNVLPDGRVVYNDAPPGVPADASVPPEGPAARDARAAIPDSLRASAARPDPTFGAGARLIVEPQALRR